MGGLKRKDVPRSSKPSGDPTAKKLKVGSQPVKKSSKPSAGSDHLEESDSTEDGDFGGFSEGDNDDNSDTEDTESDNGGTKVPKAKPATEATKTVKPNAGANGASNCMQIIHQSEHLHFLLTFDVANSSKEAHAKQKVLAQERKASKPNADFIARTKKIWERLRRKSHVPRDERKELVTELFDIITGRVKEFVFKHDSVRVIQTALKYANIDQRKMIAKELKGDYKSLAESRYAKFLIGKMLVHGDAEIRDLIVPEFYGHVRRMIKHPEASWILDDVYRGIATPQQKAIMLREWYGAEFAIFKNNEQDQVTSNLADMLAQNPEKRTPIMRSLHDLLNQLVQKKTTGFTMLHDAMLQYFLATKPGSEEATDFMELLKGDDEGDLLKNLAFTKSGARLVCLALAYGNAKDRKHILKTYKDTIQTLAYDPNGHLVLLAAYDLIDDTVLTSKAIFPELLGKDSTPGPQQETIIAYAMHLTGRIPLLYLLAGNARWLLPDDDRKLLDEIHSIRTTTSKKEPDIRRKELAKALSAPLLATVATQTESLVSTSFGCQFITEVLLGSEGEKNDALSAVAGLTNSNPEACDGPGAGRMLKTLVFGGRFNEKTKTVDLVDPPLLFHDMLFTQIEPQVVRWATGASSFVIVGLLEAEGFSHRDVLVKILIRDRKVLEKAAAEKTTEQKALEGEDNAEKAEGGAKKSKKRGSEAENKGTRLILQKLA